MDQERIAIMALHMVPGVGDILIKQLISYCGSAQEVFRHSKARLLKIPGIGVITADAIDKGRTFDLAERECRRAEREDTRILLFTDMAYPSRLKAIDDSPTLLYVKGNINLNHQRVVAVVGTRQATPYGKAQVERIIQELVPHQALIVSGLAYGIDIHAHKYALRQGLNTLGVLGSGMDIIYPAAHIETARKMINQGGLVTEHHFGTKPDAHNFPARNRIIAGLCDALIVVEAALKGGALITAEIANGYHKDVFAVPGNLDQAYSEGCNKLIKINKASLLTSVNDLEYLMNWNGGNTESQLVLEMPQFEDDEKKILDVLHQKKGAMMIDEISLRTGMGQGILSSLLLSLEFKNTVVSMPGKMYRLGRPYPPNGS